MTIDAFGTPILVGDNILFEGRSGHDRVINYGEVQSIIETGSACTLLVNVTKSSKHLSADTIEWGGFECRTTDLSKVVVADVPE